LANPLGKPAIDLTNQVFGYLLVLGRAAGNYRGQAVWNCKCSCGNQQPFSSRSLRTSPNRRECDSCWVKKSHRRGRPYESLYGQLLKNAKRRNYAVALTYEEFLTFTELTTCVYCGTLVSWTKFNRSKNGSAYNLDRKDNTVGYTKQNCVVCCSDCNRAKGDRYTHEEWMCMATALKEFRKASQPECQ
jgi:hypothetical protein